MVFVVAVCVTSIRAQEPAPQKKWMDYFAGTWEWEMPDGTPGTITWKMDGSAPVLVGHGKSGDGTWLSFMSWHGGQVALIDRVYNSEGAQSEVRYSVDQNAITGNQKGWGPDGESSADIKVTRVDEDTFEYEATNRKLAGEDQEDLKVTVKRAKNQKLPGKPVEDGNPSKPIEDGNKSKPIQDGKDDGR